jgi:hypothetical protein
LAYRHCEGDSPKQSGKIHGLLPASFLAVAMTVKRAFDTPSYKIGGISKLLYPVYFASLKHAFNPNSEDALTWSCFDVLRRQPHERIVQALNEILEDAFEGKTDFLFTDEQNIEIHIGKNSGDVSFPG